MAVKYNNFIQKLLFEIINNCMLPTTCPALKQHIHSIIQST